MTTKKTISSTCLPLVPFFVPSTYPSEVLLVCTQLLVSSTKKGKTLRSFTSAYFQKLYKSKLAVSKKKNKRKTCPTHSEHKATAYVACVLDRPWFAISCYLFTWPNKLDITS